MHNDEFQFSMYLFLLINNFRDAPPMLKFKDPDAPLLPKIPQNLGVPLHVPNVRFPAPTPPRPGYLVEHCFSEGLTT